METNNKEYDLNMKLALSNLIGKKVNSMKRIHGGRNSRIYRLFFDNSDSHIAKLYSPYDIDKRNRLEVEFSSLKFLWDNGITCVPKPIFVNNEKHIGIYEYIPGRKIPSEEVTSSDIKSITNLLSKLHEIKTKKECLKNQKKN